MWRKNTIIATFLLSTIHSFIFIQPVQAAYKCQRSCIRWSGRRNKAGKLGFCPNYNWNSCPVTQNPDTADWMAEEIYDYTIKQMGSGKEPTIQSCNETLKRFSCFMVFPVCESGTHSMRLCDKEDELLDTLLSACPHTNVTVLSNLVERARNTHTLSTQTSCFPFNYKGPGEYVYWWVGFLLCTIFSALSSVAFNLQKLSINENDKSSNPKPVYLQWKWVLGLVFLVTGSLVDFVAYGLAPQSLLTPLAALVLVWNILVAKCFGERPGKREIISVFIIFSGTTLTVAFADHYTPSYSMDDVRTLYRAPRMVAYAFFVPLFICAHLYGLRYIKKNNVINDNSLDEKTRMFYSRIECVCYAGTAGVIGGHAILFAKQAMELLKSWGAGDNIWVYYEMYFIIIGVVVGLFGNVSFLNTALRYYDSLQVIPIYQTYWIIFGTASGLVFFDEIGEMSGTQIFFFLVGCVISLAGVLVLSLRQTVRIMTNGGMQVDVANASNLDGIDNGDGNISSSGSRHSGEDDDEEDTKSLLHNTSVDSLCDLDEENGKTGFGDINIELEVNEEDQ
jgi:hypothetical protein